MQGKVERRQSHYICQNNVQIHKNIIDIVKQMKL